MEDDRAKITGMFKRALEERGASLDDNPLMMMRVEALVDLVVKVRYLAREDEKARGATVLAREFSGEAHRN